MMNDTSLSLPRADQLSAEYGMFPAGSTVLLAVSGGRDSMTLLHWAAAHRKAWQVRLAVGHYHHGMRGDAADADARRVADFCAAHGIPFFQGRGNVYDQAQKQGLGVEEAGRLLRYAFLEQTAQEVGAALIATAHNADDNAETLLLHLVRGSGLQGLTGIPPRRGNIVRPLLTTTRADIDAYATHYALPYGDDETNFDNAFARNRLRHQVTPVLRSLNPRYTETVSGAIRLLRKDNEYLNAQAAQLLLLTRLEGDTLSCPTDILAGRPFPIAVRCAKMLLTRLTGQTNFRERHLQSLLDLAESPAPSAQISLPYGVTARREYRQMVLTLAPAPSAPPAVPLTEGTTLWGPWQVTLTGPCEGLILRPRQTGDTLRLPGRPNKTLKKWMIETKIPRHLRDALPVAADGDGVLCAAGLGENTDHPLCGKTKVNFILNAEKE